MSKEIKLSDLSKEEILKRLERTDTFNFGKKYQELSDDLKSDLDIISLGFYKDPIFYQSLNKNLTLNKKIILIGIKQHPYILRNLAIDENPLHNDLDVIQLALEKNGEVFQYAPNFIKNDASFVKPAIKQYPKAFQYASNDLRNDEDVITFALKEDSSLIVYLGDKAKLKPEKAIQINFIGFLETSINPPEKKWGGLKPIQEIKKNILLNQDIHFIQAIKDQLSEKKLFQTIPNSNWDLWLSQMNTLISNKIVSEKDLINEFKFHCSYLLPCWDLNFIKKMNKKVNKFLFLNQGFKEGLNSIFHEEFKRRQILEVKQKRKFNKKLTKKRKLSF
jgi:hypothetical protein